MKIRNHTKRDDIPEIRTIQLSNSEIITLPTTPIELVPAVPGVSLRYIAGTVYKYPLTSAYTGLADNDFVCLNYSGQSSFGDIDAGFFNFAAGGDNSLTNLLGNTTALLFNNPPASSIISGAYNRPTAYSPPSLAINKALMLFASIAGGNLGGGHANNKYVISIVYYKLKVD